MNDEIDKLEGRIVNDMIALEETIVNDVMKSEEKKQNQIKLLKHKVEVLEQRIEGMEIELDEMCKMVEQTMPLRKAILEIEEYLQRKQNGFDAHYFPTLTYSRK